MDLKTFLGNSEDLAALVANLIRVGEVTNTNPASATARVRFIDRENTESFDLKVLVKNSAIDKAYHMPDIGEHVLCLFLPSGVEAGFIIGAYYPDPVARPASSEDVDCVVFGDGTRMEYNRAAHRMVVDLGPTKIIADRDHLLLESNGTSLELDAAGWRLSGARGDLN